MVDIVIAYGRDRAVPAAGRVRPLFLLPEHDMPVVGIVFRICCPEELHPLDIILLFLCCCLGNDPLEYHWCLLSEDLPLWAPIPERPTCVIYTIILQFILSIVIDNPFKICYINNVIERLAVLIFGFGTRPSFFAFFTLYHVASLPLFSDNLLISLIWRNKLKKREKTVFSNSFSFYLQKYISIYYFSKFHDHLANIGNQLYFVFAS